MFRTIIIIVGTIAVSYIIPKKLTNKIDRQAKRLGKKLWKNYVLPAVAQIEATAKCAYAKVS